MNFGWETQTERLKRHMSLPAKRKLELLYELNRFVRKYAVKKQRHREDIQTKIRDNKKF